MLGLGLGLRLGLGLGLGLGLTEEESLVGFCVGVMEEEEEEEDLEKKEVIWRCWLTRGDRPLLRRREGTIVAVSLQIDC